MTGAMQARPSRQSKDEYGRDEWNEERGCQVGHLVGQKTVGDSRVVINDFTDAPAGVVIEKAEGHLYDFTHGFTAQVGFNSECGQV